MKLIDAIEDGGYDWFAVASFKDTDGRVYYAMESGCSCNSTSWSSYRRAEDQTPSDPMPLTRETLQEFTVNVTGHMKGCATLEQIRDFIAETEKALPRA